MFGKTASVCPADPSLHERGEQPIEGVRPVDQILAETVLWFLPKSRVA